MEQTLSFNDDVDGGDAAITVRKFDRSVALTLSKRTYTDIEVFMPRDVVNRLVKALQETST